MQKLLNKYILQRIHCNKENTYGYVFETYYSEDRTHILEKIERNDQIGWIIWGESIGIRKPSECEIFDTLEGAVSYMEMMR